MEIDDSTDFEVAATFDIFAWLRSKNIIGDGEQKQENPFAARQLLEKYSLPSLQSFDANNQMKIQFTHPVNVDRTSQLSMQEIEALMKLRGATKLVLAPANDLYQDKKKFKWELSAYDEGSMSISVVFENPKYISFGGLDTLKIIFAEDPVFFTPQEAAVKVKITH